MRTWSLVAFALLIAVGFSSSGCSRQQAGPASPSEARRIAEATTVSGFVRTAVVDLSDGGPSFAQAYFIGPAPKPDLLAIVSVPTIELNPVAPPPEPLPSEKPRSYLVAAKGERADGCRAAVTSDSDPKPSIVNIRGGQPISIITAEQLDAVHSGSQVFIQLIVSGCGS